MERNGNGSQRFVNELLSRKRKQRNSLVKMVRGILLLLSTSLCTVSCSTVTIDSGFEKRTIQPGENFTLECRATGLYHVTITWLLDGLPLEYSTPEPSTSIQLKADNPHSNSNIPKREGSRYWIKNSNEVSSSSLGMKDSLDIEAESKDSNASSVPKRDTVTGNALLDAKYKESPPFVPPSIPASEDGKLTVTSILSLSNATVEDGGIYSCVARDVMRESVRWTRKIAVAGALSVRQNRPIFALIDSVVIIPCTVLGTGENLPVKWFYQKFSAQGASAVPSEGTWISLPDDHRQTVHENGSFEIRDARKNNEGVYLCQVDLKVKIANMSTPLKVMVPPKIKPFKFPQVQVGKTLADFCVVSEGDLPLDISWYKDGALLRPSERVKMHRSGKRALSFTIGSVSLSSVGNYSCCAGNNVSKTCTGSQLVVLDPPNIFDLPTLVTSISGDDVLIPCRATGFPKPNVTWMRVVDDSKRDYAQIPKMKADGVSLGANFVRVHQTENGSLMISNVSSADGGKYLCRAHNKVDELSRFVKLQVHNPARVIELSGTQDVIYKNDVIIECTSWGDGDVTVHWLKDGKPVITSGRYIGATVPRHSFIETHPVSLERLIIRNTTRSDHGTYTCKASNEYGTSAKTIDILVRAPPSIPAKFEVILKGTSFLRMVISPGEDDGGSKLLSYELTVTKIVEETPPNPREHARRTESPEVEEGERTMLVKYPASASSADQEIVLDQLECGTEYAMSIRSVNGIGQSFEGVDLSARTIGTVPIISEANDLVVDVNQTAVVLDLRAWQNGGCPITDLTIEFARHGDTEWNVTLVDSDILEKALSPQPDNGEKGGKNPGHIVISALETGTWYKIWSSACNNAGCNYVTHSVPTLLVDGSTVPPMKTDVEKEATERDDAKFLVPMVCGFGLVLLLVLLLLFYRHKQRSKKLMRLKEARKMANKLLYKTDDQSNPTPSSGGMRVELPNEREREDSEAGGEGLVETSLSCAEEDDGSVNLLTMTHQGKDSTITATYFEDPANATLDTLSNLAQDKTATPYALCERHSSNNSSTNSKKSEGKKSLKDNAELAVFRGAASSDEEDHVKEPFVCDESAFGDSGTWSYFQPGAKSRRPKKYTAVPTIEKKQNQVPRRLSSSSSGTDEELAQVFGLTSSKKQFKPVSEKEVALKSDVNENYRSAPKDHPQQKFLPQKQPARNERKRTPPKNENFYIAREQERSNSTGMMQKSDPRYFKALPGDIHPQNRRPNFPSHHRHHNQNTNPFKAGFLPAQQGPINFHRPSKAHNRGHTYSNGVPSDWNAQFSNVTQFGNPLSASPYGERQWVDTYDSRCSTNRSKPPSWGSTELDKQGFYTPQSTSSAATPREHQREGTPKFHTPDIETDQSDRTYPTKETRKIDTNSPRDSGIGSDEGPTSRNTTSSVSPPHMKGRNVLKSLESLDELESTKGDRPSSCCNANITARNEKDCIYPVSPPMTPPVREAKLTPHIFVDISSKCNTTPTRTSRSSYPPCRQVPPSNHYHLAPPKKLDYLPTPPPSGPTSPEEQPPYTRSRKRRGNDGWCVADLDRMGKYRQNNDARLSDDHEITKKNNDKSRNGDTTYTMSKDEDTWQASTLV